ncbi:hypothetical protein GCM10025864_16930 [Luteimicrobium album]|uniref:HTH lysR-type domain-containing protein n=1 Tax=Luteimicrobium album TaxID=1054550 RepID=A0ABQ6HZP2_9MICO|nr:hypothetical protein GCM10025864_16930 [Luteimicrobium album]
MDLRQMEYLVALADEQQFTRAAALCGVSQSGLSAAVRSLEDELGTTLFHRTTRRVEPTDAGLALLPHARAMLAASTAARDAVVRVTRQVTGTVRVGAEQCLAAVDPPALLERFHERYPHVEIHFTQDGSHDLLAQLRADELDVAFVATADHLGALERTPIASEPIVLLAPADHPLPARARVEWEDLDGLDFVDFQRSWGVRPLNDEACEAQGCGAACGARSTTSTRCWTSSTGGWAWRSSLVRSARSHRPRASQSCACPTPPRRAGRSRRSRDRPTTPSRSPPGSWSSSTARRPSPRDRAGPQGDATAPGPARPQASGLDDRRLGCPEEVAVGERPDEPGELRDVGRLVERAREGTVVGGLRVGEKPLPAGVSSV